MLLPVLLAANLTLTAVVVVLVFAFRARTGADPLIVGERIEGRIGKVEETLLERFAGVQADMAQRLENAKGDLRQEIADRLARAFSDMREAVEGQLKEGRSEQSATLKDALGQLEGRVNDLRRATEERLEGFADKQAGSLGEARRELSDALAKNEKSLRQQLISVSEQTEKRLEVIRGVVDGKLAEISGQVSAKLEENIKEGFKQFEKVQEHLKAAEEQLRNVNTIGSSINDLNNLLKLPHLRGRFGEASLERLLEDFLPAHMYELQAPAGENGQGRADAIIKFPERNLPIDAKFPREQVLPLFESADPSQLAAAREQFARVIKEQARRIAGYIHPENGTTDMALMYLPSETLYMEAVLNSELSEWLNSQKIFPVSPNTLIVTLQSIQMVFKMYEFAKNFEKATQELARAQKSFGYFEQRFEDIGKSLGKAQDAYGKARDHLGRYRRRVTDLTGEPVPELEGPASGEED